jgi:hypothetical protein
VTFALDSRTDIRREDKGVLRTQLGKAVNGVLTLTTCLRRSISYEITAQSDEDRQIVIEEARVDGWKPASDTSVAETPSQVTRATLVLERADSETVILTTLSAEDMLARIRGLQNESAASTTRWPVSAPSSTTSTGRERGARSLRPRPGRSSTTRTASGKTSSRSWRDILRCSMPRISPECGGPAQTDMKSTAPSRSVAKLPPAFGVGRPQLAGTPCASDKPPFSTVNAPKTPVETCRSRKAASPRRPLPRRSTPEELTTQALGKGLHVLRFSARSAAKIETR